MADQSEQHLQDISTKIQQMVDLLRGQQVSSQGGAPAPGGPGIGPGTVMSDPSGPPDYVQMMMNQQASRAEKPREIVKKADPVNIMGFAPKSLKNLAKAISGDEKSTEVKQTKAGTSFIDGLLKSIGTPLLALAGGVTALLASANIDFGAFEGLANAIGKGGFQAGLKMFTKAFGKLAGPMLRKIPVVGALISFYYANERFKKGDSIGMAIDVASGIANLLNLVMPGVGSMLSIGLDMLNAYLDYKTDGSADVKTAKTDILKEMGKKVWGAVKPFIRFIPFVGSFWLAQDAYNAFKGGDWGNAFIYTLRTLANFVPLAGTAVNIGLSVVQGLVDPSVREENAITDGAMSLIAEFGPAFKTYIEPFVRDIPFVGSFFHAMDMIEAFKGGKWISGSTSLVQTIAGFIPGVGMLLTPALSFLRGMFDPSYKGKSKLGDAGGSLMEMAIGWGEKLVAFLDPFVRDIPFLGSFFHLGDAIKAFDNGKWVSGSTSLVQTVAGFIPGVGMLLTPALSFLRGMFDPSYKGKSKLGDAGGSLMEMAIGWGEKLVAFLDPFVRDIPFLGSFFYVGDAIKAFDNGKWGQGILAFGQGVLSLVPGFGMLINPAINFLRGLFGDKKMAKKSPSADTGKKVGDWVGNMAQTAKDKLSEMIWSLVDDYVPNVWGIKTGVVALLNKMGIKKPSGVKIAKDVTMIKRSSRGPTRSTEELTKTVSSGARARTKRFNSQERDRLAAIAKQDEDKLRQAAADISNFSGKTTTKVGPDALDEQKKNIAAQKARIKPSADNKPTPRPDEKAQKVINNLKTQQQNASNIATRVPDQATDSINTQILAAIQQNNQYLAQLSTEVPKAVKEAGTTVNNNNSNVNSSTVNNQSGGQTTSSLRESVRIKYYR